MALPEGTLTFLMTDVEGSTRQWEADPEAMHDVIARHDRLLLQAVERHGGAVVRSKGEGDSVFAVFQTAGRACQAAAEAQRALSEEAWPEPIRLSVRMAIHTGEAELRDGDYYGPAPNRCARLRAVAQGGQVLVSGATQAVVETELPRALGLKYLGEHHLKDIARAERVFQLTGPSLRTEFPPLRSESMGATLPLAITSFIGRGEELGQVEEEVRRSRLVTLLGPPGVGKTRLAIEVAARLALEFDDRVCVVDLSTITDPRLVAGVIASTLGVREGPAKELLLTIADALKAERRLVVFDGCEQVVEESARAAGEILPRCPQLHLVATSREPLSIPGEVRWPLQNLSVSDAVDLFAERARLVQPSFRLTEGRRPPLEELVKKLDCIPLAIELAAARINVLNVPQMLARLDDRFRLLSGGPRGRTGRHQTLRAALEWSHDLLNQNERELFRRLSVFAGGFDIVSATGVAAAQDQDEFGLIDDVGHLVDKSLVAPEAGSGRHRMLESIRAYAREKLVEAGEAESYANLHAAHFLTLAESTDRSNIAELAAELDNFRAAQEWLDTRDAEAALRLATALSWLWTGIGQSGDGRSRLEGALARWPARDKLRATACFEAGWAAWWRGLSEVSGERFSEAASIAHQLADPLLEGRALAGHATLVFDTARDDEGAKAWALDALHRALGLLQLAGDRQGEASAVHGLGAYAVFQGNHDEAASLLDRSIAIRREIGDTEGLIYSHYWKAMDAITTGDFKAASHHAIESLSHAPEPSTHPMTGAWLEMVAELAARQGDLASALTLYAVADREQTVAGINRWNPVPEWGGWRSRALASLPAAEGESASARGQAMAIDDALAYARELLTGRA